MFVISVLNTFVLFVNNYFISCLVNLTLDVYYVYLYRIDKSNIFFYQTF